MDEKVLTRCSGDQESQFFGCRSVWANGPVIVGAGPSGLATGACLKRRGVPFVILERSDCIASLWQHRTYHRLQLHLPKRFCHLPFLDFPPHFPQYPSKHQFLDYLDSYASLFDLRPTLGTRVLSAIHDRTSGLWRVRTAREHGAGVDQVEYICKWLVVATGENAQKVVPEFEGMEEFYAGSVIHACEYKSGEEYRGKKVLVVGCANSGMDVSLDLCDFEAKPVMVVRNSVHVLPREVFGRSSTFEVASCLLQWLPLSLVDRFLLLYARCKLGEVDRLGLRRPAKGPLRLKSEVGRTPVLDAGTLGKIKAGEVRVVAAGIKRFREGTVEFDNGEQLEIDAVVLATGYKSNVPSWLKDSDLFSTDGFPKQPFRDGWKGKSGLYAVGFTRRGLSGASMDALRVAEDIAKMWKEEMKQPKQFISFHRIRRS